MNLLLSEMSAYFRWSQLDRGRTRTRHGLVLRNFIPGKAECADARKSLFPPIAASDSARKTA